MAGEAYEQRQAELVSERASNALGLKMFLAAVDTMIALDEGAVDDGLSDDEK